MLFEKWKENTSTMQKCEGKLKSAMINIIITALAKMATSPAQMAS